MAAALQADLVLRNTSVACSLSRGISALVNAHSGTQMEFPQRLKKARERIDLNQGQLGEMLGVSAQTVQQWESGRTMPRHKRIDSLAELLGVRAQWLIFGQGPMVSRGEDELIFADTEVVEDDQPAAHDEVDVPFLREIEFAAGDGRCHVLENHGKSMRFPLARLSKAGVQPQNAACATLTGNSMEPAIMDGSAIGIDKGRRSITDGDIFALDHCGMLRVKRLYRLPLNRMRVVSENSIEYPEETYQMDDPEAPKIIGRVFWFESFL